jgi:hypothetical protein
MSSPPVGTFSALMLPPWARMMLLQMDSPRPETFRPGSEVYSGSKICWSSAGATPCRCPETAAQLLFLLLALEPQLQMVAFRVLKAVPN